MSSQKRKSDIGAKDASSNKKPKTVNASITSFFGAPKTAAVPSSSPSSTANGAGAGAAVSEPAAPKFDKAAWVKTLSVEQKRYLALEIQTLHPSWLAHLKDEIVKPEFIALKKFLEAEAKAGKTIFPPNEDIYSWYASQSGLLPVQLSIYPTLLPTPGVCSLT